MWRCALRRIGWLLRKNRLTTKHALPGGSTALAMFRLSLAHLLGDEHAPLLGGLVGEAAGSANRDGDKSCRLIGRGRGAVA